MNDPVKDRPSIEKRVTFENYSTVVTAASTMDTYLSKQSSEDSDSEGSFSGYDSYTVGMVERGLGACGIDHVHSVETLNSSDSEEDDRGCAGIMNALERKSTIRREYACGEHEHSDKLWKDRRENNDLRYLSKFAAKIGADRQMSGDPSPILSLNSCKTGEKDLSSSEDVRDDDSRGDDVRDDAKEDYRRVCADEDEDRTDTISVISEGLSKMFAETNLFNIQEKGSQDGAEERNETETVSKVSHKSTNESSSSNKIDQPESASVVTSSTGKSTRTSSSSNHRGDHRDNVSIVTTSTATTKKRGKNARGLSSSSRHRIQSDTVSVITSATTSTKKSRKEKEKNILKNQEEHGGRKSGVLGWRKKKDKSYKQNNWTKQDSDRIEL